MVQMNFGKLAVSGLVFGTMLVLAGCNAGDGASGLGLGGSSSQQKAEEEKVLASELEGHCPKVELHEGTAYLTTYTKGGEGDPANAIYQASITDVTRYCKRANGMLTMTVAAAGKVVPGPKADGKTVTLPIRVVVNNASATDGQVNPYMQTQNVQVTIVAGQAATQFVFSDPNPSFPADIAKAVRIFVGFDEGPQPKKKPGGEG